ncbi:MAG: hypothetical protein CL609_16130 [Anaerolineaceae bacterium]|nr:hypothetical protein [Anaerolineaceae bacterium]
MILKEIANLIHQINSKTRFLEFNREYRKIIFFHNNSAELNDWLKRDWINRYGRESIEIPLNNIQGLFFDKTDFLNEVVLRDFSSDIILLDIYQGEDIFYNAEKKEVVKDSSNLFENTHYYLLFKEAVEQSNLKIFHNSELNEFGFHSQDYGLIRLHYPQNPPDFGHFKKVKQNYELFKSLKHDEQFLIYLNNQIYKTIFNKTSDDPSFVYFIKHFDTIVAQAEDDFSIYLRKFSFEAFNKNFRKEQIEYFSSLRDILSKIQTNIVSIPVSISITVAAVFEVKDKPELALLIVVGYIFYSLLSAYLLRNYEIDIDEIKDRLDQEAEIIRENVVSNKDKINHAINKIYKKIKRAKITAKIIQFLLVILTLLVLFISWWQLNLDLILILILSIILFVFHLIIIFFKIKEK